MLMGLAWTPGKLASRWMKHNRQQAAWHGWKWATMVSRTRVNAGVGAMGITSRLAGPAGWQEGRTNRDHIATLQSWG